MNRGLSDSAGGRHDVLDDRERYPTLGEAGRRMLTRLLEHDAAPRYRNRSGNKLTAEDVASLRAFEHDVATARIDWSAQRPPAWIGAHIARTYAEVPYYRAMGSAPSQLTDVPTVARADLSHDIAAFVPDTVALDRLIQFSTSGTTGHRLLVPSHPRVAGRYLAFHKRALRRFGIELDHGRDQVGVILLGYQTRCFTYVSVTPSMDESGLAKINLHPDDWRDPGDRARYLDAMAPEVLAGDPISFAALLDLPVRLRPRALVSVSMMLAPGLRRRLEQRFGCPVLDVYSLNEVGPVAVFDPAVGGHALLQDRLYIELLDDAGRAVAPGATGEIVVTGGFNFCLPLLRYRTGDYAALSFAHDTPVLIGLQGRRPVRFRAADGRWFNNVDVTHALAEWPLAQFGLHQQADGAMTLRLPAGAMSIAAPVCAALTRLFGATRIAVEAIVAEDKIVQYTSDLEQGAIGASSFAAGVSDSVPSADDGFGHATLDRESPGRARFEREPSDDRRSDRESPPSSLRPSGNGANS